ncbi:hypothetical protein ACFL6O_02475 [candidate division KSB1 bacterium]
MNFNQLTSESGLCINPSWSPDASKIIFSKNIPGYNIVTITRDGENLTVLTNGGNNYNPTMSPDGTQIAFFKYPHSIFIMNSDGTNQKELITFEHTIENLKWSPHDSKIGYVYVEYGPDNSIYPVFKVIDINTLVEEEIIVSEEISFYDFTWSPDGSKIAYCSNGDLYSINSNGTNRTQLTDDFFFDSSPSFSPDGQKIAFYSENMFFKRYNNHPSGIYIITTDGTNQRLLFRVSDIDDISWSPLIR